MAENARVGRVGSPDTRGTIQILITCLSTVCLCTFSSLHLNLPKYRVSTQRQYFRRLGNMIYAILTPELIAIPAFLQLWHANQLKKLFKRYSISWTLAHTFYLVMNGFEYEDTGSRETQGDSPNLVVLKAEDVRKFLREGSLDFESISEEEVRDKGEADEVAKTLACWQATYFVAQILGRVIQGLPVSCLEVGTVAYVPLTILSYVFWWHKPFNPTARIQIPILSGDKVAQKQLPDDLDTKLELRGKAFCFAIAPITMVFKAPHLTLWNSSVLSVGPQQLLWRVSSIAMVALPCITTFSFALMLVGKFKDHIVNVIIFVCAYLSIIVYAISRLIIIVEMFYSLQSSPKDIYKDVEWSQFIPHL